MDKTILNKHGLWVSTWFSSCSMIHGNVSSASQPALDLSYLLPIGEGARREVYCCTAKKNHSSKVPEVTRPACMLQFSMHNQSLMQTFVNFQMDKIALKMLVSQHEEKASI